jgi:hypothetical protein
MRVLGRVVATLLLTAGAAAFPACSCEDSAGHGSTDLAAADFAMSPITEDFGVVVPSQDGGCTTTGKSCAVGGDCCSGMCDPTMLICTLGQCGGDGAMCRGATDCCNLNCNNGTCLAKQCVSDNQPCTVGGDACCSTQCVNGSCQPLNTTCKTAGNGCGLGTECCSRSCIDQKCAAPSQVSYCTQAGDICFRDNECCGGVCNIANGATAGTCARLGTLCDVDGTVCSGCTGCCSSYCQPFGTSGSRICQPTSGCRVLGDLCLKDFDCCGGDASSGLPGAGLVRCIPDPNYPQIGTCGQPNPNNCTGGQPTCKNTCQPEGDVCHYTGNGGCSSNSFPNNCCEAPGNKGECKLDKVGVPRCYGLGAMCVAAGGACASSADCCDGRPCVPGTDGHLVCGSMSCVPAGGICTTTGDCCTGYACAVPPGATSGTCVNPTAPPPQNDMGNADLSNGVPMCALDGQSCTSTSQCCSGAQCLEPTGAACGGGTSCACITPIS